MLLIRCTSKLLADIDNLPSMDAATTSSSIGDWYGHIFRADRRKCILFINEPTLFVCPAFCVSKSDYRHIIPFFLDVLTWSLRVMMFSEKETRALTDRVLGMVRADAAEVSVGSGSEVNLRFANNDITTNGVTESVRVSITASFGKRSP